MASSIGRLLSVVLFVGFSFNLSSSIIQEMQILENYGANLEGNAYTFRHSVPDTTQFNISEFKQMCAKGSWGAYAEKYYSKKIYGWDVTSLSCTSIPWDKPLLSFRFLGSGNSSLNGVSLYAEENQEGREVYVDRWPYGGITMPVKSIAWSGTSNFTFYEGTNFEGKYVCVTAGSWYYAAESEDNIQKRYNLTTVGSVLKGCVDYLSDRDLALMFEHI